MKFASVLIVFIAIHQFSIGQSNFSNIKSINQVPQTPVKSKLMAMAMLSRNFSTLKLDSAILLVNQVKKEAVKMKFYEVLRLAQAVEIDLESTSQDYTKLKKSGLKLIRESNAKKEILTASIVELAIGRM